MFFVHGPDFLVRLAAALVLFKPYAGGTDVGFLHLLQSYFGKSN